MDTLEEIRNTIRNYEISYSDPYNYEVFKEKLIRELRNSQPVIITALSENTFTPEEVLSLSEVSPDYVSLSGAMGIVDAISSWADRHSDTENTTEIRLYIAEAKRIYSSLFIQP